MPGFVPKSICPVNECDEICLKEIKQRTGHKSVGSLLCSVSSIVTVLHILREFMFVSKLCIAAGVTFPISKRLIYGIFQVQITNEPS